jgi:hypothetical protein
MEVQPKDTSKGHFYVSIAKSAVRIFAGANICFGNLLIGGTLIIVAEKNKAKLNAAKEAGYNVILVLNKEYVNA